MDPNSDQADPAARTLKVLEATRQAEHPGLPAALLAEIATIEEQNQFDDDRSKARRAIRDLIDQYARSAALTEGGSK